MSIGTICEDINLRYWIKHLPDFSTTDSSLKARTSSYLHLLGPYMGLVQEKHCLKV